MLKPQVQTVPSDFLARQWPSPAAIAVTPVRFFTCTGTDELVVVPLPSSPSVFIPQPQTVPSDLSATVCPPAAAIAVTPVRPCTCTGTDELVVVPLQIGRASCRERV